jgi:hypothetical protein
MKPMTAAALLVVLAGCSPISGLRPVDPPFRYGGLPEVLTVRPRLEWEPFIPPAKPENGWSRIRDVTYDLQVWSVEGDAPAELVYARQGLSKPFHRIEIWLLPGRLYLWTVRARFDLDGAMRVTEWGSARKGSDLPQVPNPFYYRFVTPTLGPREKRVRAGAGQRRLRGS